MNKNLTRDVYIREANRLLGQKLFQEAIRKCLRAISLDPHHALAYTIWGIALFGAQDLDKAAIKFSKALQINPSNARAYYNYGGFYYHKGNYEEAAVCFEQAWSMSSNPKYLQFWGLTLLSQGKYDEAYLKFEELNCDDPRAPIPRICRCLIYSCQEKRSEARVLFEQTLAILNPTQTKAQIVHFMEKDLNLTQKKIEVVQDPQQKEYENQKIVALRYYLNKILDIWPE